MRTIRAEAPLGARPGIGYSNGLWMRCEVYVADGEAANNLDGRATRRRFLEAAGAGCVDRADERSGLRTGQARLVGNAFVRGEGSANLPPDALSFRSRLDLRPPGVRVATPAHGTAGYIFLAPKEGSARLGPMIVDNAGQLCGFGLHTAKA